MDLIDDLPPAVQDRLPAGPDLTDWLLAELDRAHAAAVRAHQFGCEATCRGSMDSLGWLTMARTFVLKHRAAPTYATNVADPTGPDVPSGWHCRECGMERDGPVEDWPCEVLVMIATVLWQSQRPSLPVSWAWTAPEDRLIWARQDAGEHDLEDETDQPERTA